MRASFTRPLIAGLTLYKYLYIIPKVPKDLYWVGRSKEDLRDFPAAARHEAGHQLNLVQLGLNPDDYRPMPSVGAGVLEIRVHTDTEFRVFYIAKHSDTVFVLHAFEKKTRKTTQHDIELGKDRLKEVKRWLRDRKQ
ncbi:MAG: type II toxin-antitoxin system RelE/ParE family toxin [Gemmatimonadota bacterium]